jgi:two-component system cell cycle response regulator
VAGSDRQTEPSILLVEDDPLTRQQLEELLAGKFPDLDVAENGEQGLKQYEERRHDIVITDILMPVLDGLDMANRIRRLNPGAQIVIITAYTELAQSTWVRQVAANYVQKPIDFDELIKILDSCRNRIMEERKGTA